MTRQEYLNSKAIYHPTGGHKTGKIYNVKDYLVENKNLLRSDSESSWGISSSGNVSLVRVYDEEGWSDQNFAIFKATPDTTLQEQYKRTSSAGITDYSGNLYVSFYAKSLGVNIVGLSAGTTPYGSPRVDIVNKTFVNTGLSTNHLIEDVGNGWVRVSYIYTGDLSNYSHIGFYSPEGANFWASNGTDSMLLSGLMLSEGTELKDYYPSSEFRDLTVTGGGGTRILADGSLEDTIYNRLDASNYDASTNNWLLSNATLSSVKTDLAAGNNLFTLSTTSGYLSMDFPVTNGENINMSIFIKKGNTNFANLTFASTESVADSYWVYRVDLVNKTIVKNEALAGKTALNTFNPVLEEVGNEGYLRFSADLIVENPEEHRIILRGVDDAEGTSSIGNTLIFGGGQVTRGFGVKPLQIKNNTAAYPKIDHTTDKPAFLIEPQRTNVVPFSYDLLSDTKVSVNNGTMTTSLTEVGITGIPNTALVLEDTDTSTFSQLGSSWRTFGAYPKVVYKLWIKKDDDETRFPEFAIASSNVNITGSVQLNTKTGELGYRGTVPSGMQWLCIDRGNWWELDLEHVYPDVDRYTSFSFRPAFTNTLGGEAVNSVTGSVTIGHFGVYPGGSIGQETPIITNGVGVTRTINKYIGTANPISKGSGYLYIHVDKTAKGHIGLNGTNSDNLISFAFRNGVDDMRAYFKQVNNSLSAYHAIPSDSDTKALIKYTLGTGGSYDVRLFINGSLVESRADAFPNGVEIINITNLNSFLVGFSNTEFSGRIYNLIRSKEAISDARAINLTKL